MVTSQPVPVPTGAPTGSVTREIAGTPPGRGKPNCGSTPFGLPRYAQPVGGAVVLLYAWP
jgi:hypothetical protein